MIYKNFEEFKQNTTLNSRLISLDYGLKKTGIAISDRKLTIATPYGVIKTSSVNVINDELARITKENIVSAIVIGYPLLKDGTASKICLQIDIIALQIQKFTQLPILLTSERNSSTKAQDILINLNMKRKRRDAIDDKIAASIILQTVLDQLR